MTPLSAIVNLDTATEPQRRYAVALYTEACAAARIERLAALYERATAARAQHTQAHILRELNRYNAVWNTARAEQLALGSDPLLFWQPVAVTPALAAAMDAEAASDARWDAAR